MQPKRKIIRENAIDKDFETNEDIAIDDLLDLLVKAKGSGSKFIRFWASGSYDGNVDEIEISTFFYRDESDEEFFKRVEEEKWREEKRQQ